MMHETDSHIVCASNKETEQVSVRQKLASVVRRCWHWIIYALRRMSRWLAHYLKSFAAKRAEILKLQAALRAVQLDLDDRDAVIRQLHSDIERERAVHSMTTAAASDSALETAMTDLALPMTQLATQMYLAEHAGRPLNPKDVSAVLNRLVKNAAHLGLSLEGAVGDVVPYDADHHEPLSSDAAPAQGSAVTIRMPGAAFKGTVIRKAAVEPHSG